MLAAFDLIRLAILLDFKDGHIIAPVGYGCRLDTSPSRQRRAEAVEIPGLP
jgi:hypothetical protein